ncbi:hypothetical protein Nmel_010995, partial [Mimus melanotis]
PIQRAARSNRCRPRAAGPRNPPGKGAEPGTQQSRGRAGEKPAGFLSGEGSGTPRAGDGAAPAPLSPFTNSEAPPNTSEAAAAGSILKRARSSEARGDSELMALQGSAGGAGARSQGRDPLPGGAARQGPRCCEHSGRSPHRSGAENEPRDTAGKSPQGLQLHPAPSQETPPDKAAAGGYQATGGALATALRSLCVALPRADAASDRPPALPPLPPLPGPAAPLLRQAATLSPPPPRPPPRLPGRRCRAPLRWGCFSPPGGGPWKSAPRAPGECP